MIQLFPNTSAPPVPVGIDTVQLVLQEVRDCPNCRNCKGLAVIALALLEAVHTGLVRPN